jgi:8-oxo-dGTP pyrophosphatase MutT (NUDIX family)
VPAATVVLLRDAPGSRHAQPGVEVLLLLRNRELAFAGGHWVFPGGRVDAADLTDAPAARLLGELADDEADRLIDHPALSRAARQAAARETREETGLVLDPDQLVWFAHWTPPAGRPRRFATWFFAAAAPDGHVIVDGGEIHDHAWLRPTEALARRDAGVLDLTPPTWVTLWRLREHPSVTDALADLAAQPVERFATRLVPEDDHLVALWTEDAGYAEADPARAGTRHRLVMRDGGWSYHRD